MEANAILWPKTPQIPGYGEFAQVDFVKRLGISEQIKAALRLSYSRAVRQTKGEPFERSLQRSRAFWEQYDWINHIWTPEDPVYSKAFQGITLTTTNDLWEFGAAAAGQLRILESFIGGEATASTVLRFGINRVSSQGTGTAPATYTPEKFNTRSPAAAGTYYGALTAQVAWGTAQATLNTNPVILHAFNAFGGTDRWVPQPGEEIYLVNAEFISGRSISGAPVVSGHVVVEEL